MTWQNKNFSAFIFETLKKDWENKSDETEVFDFFLLSK